VLRQVVPPLVTAYAIFVATVVLARRRPVARPRIRGDRSAPEDRRSAIGTIVGGYAVFLVIVLFFHVWLAGETDAIASAVWGGVFLSGVALVVGLGSSVFGRRR